MKKQELESENSGRKPSNEADVCGPKSGETSRPSIKQSGIDHCDPVFDVIDQMYSAQLSANESQKLINELRPRVEEAVQTLILQQGKPKNWTGTLEYHGFKIVVSRPKSYTWEQNTQISDTALDYYKSLHAMCEQLNNDLKKRRAEMKGVAESLRISYPASESIKLGFRIAFV